MSFNYLRTLNLILGSIFVILNHLIVFLYLITILKIEKSNFDMINEKYATEPSVVEEKKTTPKPDAPKPVAPKHNKDSFIKESILKNFEIKNQRLVIFNGLSNITTK